MYCVCRNVCCLNGGGAHYAKQTLFKSKTWLFPVSFNKVSFWLFSVFWVSYWRHVIGCVLMTSPAVGQVQIRKKCHAATQEDQECQSAVHFVGQRVSALQLQTAQQDDDTSQLSSRLAQYTHRHTNRN